MHCYSFSVKQKGEKKKPKAQPKLRPLSPQALVSKMAQIAKQSYIFSSLLNSRSSKSRNLKLLLEINALCNFVCNSLSKLNSVLRYLVKNMLGYSTKCCNFRNFEVLRRITDLFFKMYLLCRKHLLLLLFLFFPFKSLILGPDFQKS